MTHQTLSFEKYRKLFPATLIDILSVNQRADILGMTFCRLSLQFEITRPIIPLSYTSLRPITITNYSQLLFSWKLADNHMLGINCQTNDIFTASPAS